MAYWNWNATQSRELLKNSLLGIHPNYFSIISPSGEPQYMERIFAYELYHQMRMRFPIEDGHVNNVVISGEYRKALSFVPDLGRNDIMIPDIIVHQSMTTDKNLIAIEIKCSPNPSPESDILRDLIKLNFYAKSLSFHIAIFIIVNSKFENSYFKNEEIRQKISNLMKDCGRIKIWNIERPIAEEKIWDDKDRSTKLDLSCLKIIGFEDLKNLTNPYDRLQDSSKAF